MTRGKGLAMTKGKGLAMTPELVLLLRIPTKQGKII
jgi:hypothetical protein